MEHDAHPLAGQRVWAHRRSRARSLLASIGATVFVLAFCLSATVGFVAASSVAGIRSTLATVPASDSSVVVRAPEARNVLAQDRGVRAVVARTFAGTPIVITSNVDTSKPGVRTVRWTITPSRTLTTPGDLPRLRRGFTHIRAAVIASSAAHSPSAELSGHAAATVLTMQRAVGALGAIEPIPLTVLSLSGIVALLLARGLLTDYRRNETRFLRSRGGSGATILWLDARESMIVSLIGAITGSLAAQVALLIVVGPPVGIGEIFLPPVVVFAIALAVNAVLAGIAARAASGVPRSESGRRRAAAPWTLTGFGIVITVIALWRFEQNGVDGASFAADPSAVLAPGALLCAGTLLCLLAAGRITAGAESGLRPGRSRALFPIRAVNRHIAVVVGPSALLAIAIAIAAVTGTYSGSWKQFSTGAHQLTTGGDLRATVGTEPLLSDATDLLPLAKLRSVRGVKAAAPAMREEDTFGDIPVTVLAVRASDIPALLSHNSTATDPAGIARDLGTSPVLGVRLPAHATAVSLTISATGKTTGKTALDDTVVTTLWLQDAHGDLFPLGLRAAPVGAPGSIGIASVGPLPSTGGPWVIAAIDVGVSASDAIGDFRFDVQRISATVAGTARAVAIPASQHWTTRDHVFNNGANKSGPVGTVGFRRNVTGGAVGGVSVRMMPRGAATVPIVLSRPFAAATGLVRGSRMSVDGQWASFDGVVTGIVASVPGAATGRSLIVNLPALDRAWLGGAEQIPAANEVWMSSGAPAATRSRISAAIPAANVTVAGSAGGDQIIRGATVALWIGAIGTSAFAIIALAAAAIALLRRRSTETRALRALGVRPGTQSALRRRELGIVGIVGLAVGAVVGTAVSLLVAATMTRLSTPTAPPALPLYLAIDPLPVVATLVLLAVAFAVCLAVYGSSVGRQARGRS